MTRVGWTVSDAWVFAAIEGRSAEDGSSLARILIKAEGINHAGLLEEEFSRAVPRLLGAGLIGADEHLDRYWHTQAGRELYVKAMKGRGLFGWSDGIPAALGRLGEPNDLAWVLPPGAYERAVTESHDAYRARARSSARTAPGVEGT